MRPRVFPAEDPPFAEHPGHRILASMRPRVFPAEDPESHADFHEDHTGFNEAAGIPRGRPTMPLSEPFPGLKPLQ